MFRRLLLSSLLLSPAATFAFAGSSAGPVAAPASDAAPAAAPAPIPAAAPTSFSTEDPTAESAQTRTATIFFRHAKSFSVPGLTAAVSMDDSVCKVTVHGDQLDLLGFSRGDSVVIYWTDSGQTNMLVHILDEPAIARPPSLGRGTQFGTNGFVRTFTSMNFSGGQKSMLLNNQFAWTSDLGDKRSLSFQGTTEDDIQKYGHGFNFTTFSSVLHTDRYTAQFGDYSIVLRPDSLGRMWLQFPTPVLTLRGADVLMKRGGNSYEVFAGEGIPSFFLSYGGVSRAAGVNYMRQLNGRMSLLVSGLYSAALQNPFTLMKQPRQTDFTVLPVLTVRLSDRLSFEGGAGFSPHGLRVTAETTYHGNDYDLFGAFSRMDSRFPFQLLRAGATSGQNLSFGGSYRFSRRFSLTATLQHHFADFDKVQNISYGASNNFGVSGSYVINNRQSLNASYSRGSESVFDGVGLRHFDVGWTSVLGPATNSLQFSTVKTTANSNATQDNREFSLLDGVHYSVRPGLGLIGSVSYSRTNFPLLARIQQQIGLLDPQLQQLFLTNPVAFINSTQLSPEIRAAIDGVQPSALQFSAGADISHGRWSLSPQFSFGLENFSDSVSRGSNHDVQFGYHGSYQLGPTLWADSSLSHQYFVNRGQVEQTSLITVGVQKSLNSSPVHWISSKFERRSIRGRVFIDHKGDGTYHQGDVPVAGVHVDLSNGTTALTDENGNYEFHGLSPRVYHVELPIGQFATAVRLTGSNVIDVDLSGPKDQEADFGIVRSARIIGIVYNDYLMDSERQPDAPRVGGVRIRITRDGGESRTAAGDAGGDFDIGDLEPGHYVVSVDPDSVPTGYYVEGDGKSLDLAAVSSAVVELPVRAMRSISGKVVYRKADDQTGTPQPLEGVTLSAGQSIAKTGPDGSFLLRNLPAGDLTLSVVPSSSAVPGSVQLPQGRIHMPFDPKQVENVVITVTDPALLNYLPEKVATDTQSLLIQ